MKTFLSYMLMLIVVLFTGCKDNPVEIHEDDGNEPFTAELTISDDHIHTLSEITYTVKITDHHGETVTNMEAVEVQRKGHDDTEWRGTELTLAGEVYTGTYTFNSSGEYDLRVAGIRHGGTEMEVMHEMEDHMEVARAHVETGNYRIEYENFPGHIHDGETATVKFWIYEAEKDASGVRPPITGLGIHIHCNNPDGSNEHHDTVTEESAGIYMAEHTFLGGGEAQMGMHFTAPDNNEVEAEFHLHIAHGH